MLYIKDNKIKIIFHNKKNFFIKFNYFMKKYNIYSFINFYFIPILLYLIFLFCHYNKNKFINFQITTINFNIMTLYSYNKSKE